LSNNKQTENKMRNKIIDFGELPLCGGDEEGVVFGPQNQYEIRRVEDDEYFVGLSQEEYQRRLASQKCVYNPILKKVGILEPYHAKMSSLAATLKAKDKQFILYHMLCKQEYFTSWGEMSYTMSFLRDIH